jgi:hypothetical protein
MTNELIFKLTYIIIVLAESNHGREPARIEKQRISRLEARDRAPRLTTWLPTV